MSAKARFFYLIIYGSFFYRFRVGGGDGKKEKKKNSENDQLTELSELFFLFFNISRINS